eukprot:scaffold684_cov95-Isochrysis_galbana.AAC.3
MYTEKEKRRLGDLIPTWRPKGRGRGVSDAFRGRPSLPRSGGLSAEPTVCRRCMTNCRVQGWGRGWKGGENEQEECRMGVGGRVCAPRTALRTALGEKKETDETERGGEQGDGRGEAAYLILHHRRRRQHKRHLHAGSW